MARRTLQWLYPREAEACQAPWRAGLWREQQWSGSAWGKGQAGHAASLGWAPGERTALVGAGCWGVWTLFPAG